MSETPQTAKKLKAAKKKTSDEKLPAPVAPVAETGGQTGPEPTRYGDWEKGGRCSDF